MVRHVASQAMERLTLLPLRRPLLQMPLQARAFPTLMLFSRRLRLLVAATTAHPAAAALVLPPKVRAAPSIS